MAKSKSTSSTKLQSASPTKRKPPGSNGRSSPSADKPANSVQAGISGQEIGHVAGQIWGLLSTDGGQTLAAIKKSIDAPTDLVTAAIGWLAREDKVEFTSSGRTVKISLR